MHTPTRQHANTLGKSSVINSLLGAKYLAEGILPTTNEISVLKHAADGNERVRIDMRRHEDTAYTQHNDHKQHPAAHTCTASHSMTHNHTPEHLT